MSKFNQKGVIQFILLLALLIGIVAGVFLITSGNPLKFFSRASNPSIVVKDKDGHPLPEVSGIPQTADTKIKLELTSPLGPTASGASPSANPRSTTRIQ